MINNFSDIEALVYIMGTTKEHDKRIAEMKFSSVYPCYVTKVEKKGRTKDELHQVIEWLTGFNEDKLNELIKNQVSLQELAGTAVLAL